MTTSYELRVFTKDGSLEFERLMSIYPHPKDILEQVAALRSNQLVTEDLNLAIELEPFKRRYELGEYLWNLINGHPQMMKRRGDKNFWNWLSAAYMPLLVTEDSASLDKQLGKQFERWVLTENTLRYHRHLVSSPYFAFERNSKNPMRAMILLASDVLVPGEAVEKISGTRRLASGSAMFLATLLWVDGKSGQLRPDRTSKKYAKIRDLNAYMGAIDLNVDFEEMDVSTLLDILPPHFSHWVNLGKSDIKFYL